MTHYSKFNRVNKQDRAIERRKPVNPKKKAIVLAELEAKYEPQVMAMTDALRDAVAQRLLHEVTPVPLNAVDPAEGAVANA